MNDVSKKSYLSKKNFLLLFILIVITPSTYAHFFYVDDFFDQQIAFIEQMHNRMDMQRKKFNQQIHDKNRLSIAFDEKNDSNSYLITIDGIESETSSNQDMSASFEDNVISISTPKENIFIKIKAISAHTSLIGIEINQQVKQERKNKEGNSHFVNFSRYANTNQTVSGSINIKMIQKHLADLIEYNADTKQLFVTLPRDITKKNKNKISIKVISDKNAAPNRTATQTPEKKPNIIDEK